MLEVKKQGGGSLSGNDRNGNENRQREIPPMAWGRKWQGEATDTRRGDI
jgi:hypothetical protein